MENVDQSDAQTEDGHAMMKFAPFHHSGTSVTQCVDVSTTVEHVPDVHNCLLRNLC